MKNKKEKLGWIITMLLTLLSLFILMYSSAAADSGTNQIEIVPISAEFVELAQDEYNFDFCVSGREGWRLLLVKAAITNISNNFITFPPSQLSGYSNLTNNISVISQDGKYRYTCIGAENLNNTFYIPGGFCLYTYFSKDWSAISGYSGTTSKTPIFAFQVPASMDNLYFQFGDNSLIELGDITNGQGNHYTYVDEQYSEYSTRYTKSAIGAELSFGNNGTLTINSVSSTTIGTSIEMTLKNDGGYDEVMDPDDWFFEIVDANNVIYRLSSQASTITVAPQYQKTVVFELSPLPDGYSAEPVYLFVYDSHNQYGAYCITPDASTAQTMDADEMLTSITAALNQSEAVYHAYHTEGSWVEPITNFYICNDQVYGFSNNSNKVYISDIGYSEERFVKISPEIIGVIDDVMIVSDDYHTSRISLEDEYGNVMNTIELDEYYWTLNYDGNAEILYLYNNSNDELKIMRVNLSSGEKSCFEFEYKDSCKSVADIYTIYRVDENGIMQYEIASGKQIYIESDFDDFYKWGDGVYLSDDYLLIAGDQWYIFDRCTREIYKSPFSSEIDGTPVFDGSTIYFIDDASPWSPDIVRYNIDTQVKETVYKQELISESYYHGLKEPLRLDGDYLYFLYDDRDNGYFVHRIYIR